MTPRKLFGILGAVLGILLLAGNLGAVDSSDAVVRKERETEYDSTTDWE